ncbi:olfactory receptor 51G2-like [Rhinoderma darwinii]|uniref:olfactory receptor 51G2-like n=1 Tax=Rhinoderma darwinii TaxID=43563 RepID=UPI003F66C5B1
MGDLFLWISSMNTTDVLEVVLVGIPGLEHMYSWILVLFCFLYVFSLIGNGILLFIIRTDVSLQMPMYDLVSMLAVTDLGLALVTLPTVLGVFSLHSVRLPLPLCLLQMFLIHCLSVMESSVLVTMAYDRFVAICNPLRYSSLLTRPFTARMGLLAILRGVAVILPIPVMLQSSRLCKSRMLSHAYCLHPDMMRLIRSPLRANNMYSIFAVVSTMGLDGLLITLSYVFILTAVRRLAAAAERCKVFHTCARHVSVVLLFYGPMISLSIIHRFGDHKSNMIQAPLAYLHFLLPPVMNPIVYGVKTKQIYQRLIHKLRRVPFRRDKKAQKNFQ